MSRIAAPFTALTLALALGAFGCGNPDVVTVDPGKATTEENPYLPMKVGNTWQYRVTDSDNVVTDKTTEVLEEQPVGGTGPNKDLLAFFVRTTKTGAVNEDKTESWQGTVEIAKGQYASVRYREISYHAGDGMKELEEHWTPYKLRVDNYHVAPDAWDENYLESKFPTDPTQMPEIDGMRYDKWGVQADEEDIMVAGRALKAKVFIRQATDAQGSDKVYWFVKGIGKVRETGSQTEELEDCRINNVPCADIPQE